jgi:transketolase
MDKLTEQLKQKSYELRTSVLDMCTAKGIGHLTSSLSCMELMVALYYGGLLRYDPENPRWEGRDRFILSKGQASPALYAILADLGFFDRKELLKFAQKDGSFGVHLQHDVPGVEITSGSLGMGLGIAAGMALSARMNRELYMTYVLLGDGEICEGSVWESAMFAGHQRLNNLVAIIDRNGLCATDFTENLVSLESIDDKWRSFGWDVARIDGHCLKTIMRLLGTIRSRRSPRPLMVIADTVKGEGIECLEHSPLWHGISPKGKEAEEARACLVRRYCDE